MLARYRSPLCARLAVPALLLGIALAWAAPARAATVLEGERQRAADLIATGDGARVEAALDRASRLASSPEEFAAEVVRALADAPGSAVSPAADALLRALFGRFIQALSLGQGGSAVFVSAPSPDRAPAPEVRTVAPEARAAIPAPVVFAAGASNAPREDPREARPSIQTQGP